MLNYFVHFVNNVPYLPYRNLGLYLISDLRYGGLQQSMDDMVRPALAMPQVEISASSSLARHLTRPGPFRDHRQVDDRCASTTCRACRNRMVPGGTRLPEVSESGVYIYCDDDWHPRLAS